MKSTDAPLRRATVWPARSRSIAPGRLSIAACASASARSARTSGCTARVSPSETAWIQMTGPPGRAP